MATVNLRAGDRSWAVEILANGEVRIAGHARPLTVSAIEPGVYAVCEEGRRTLVYATTNGTIHWAFADGRVFEFELERSDASRRGLRSGQDALTAPMPATVVKILVAPGQEVAASETVLVLEAMKMELPIRAPRHARVRAVLCREGELVQPGVPLVDLEP